MKLQLALDDLTLVEAYLLVNKVKNYIDIIEIGTPFIYKEGLQAVKYFKEKFPEKEILADLKIMDAGYYEATEAFRAGADYITALAVTDILTIQECVKAANEWGKEIVVDMICVQNFKEKIAELELLGAHGLAVHTGTDQQAAGRRPIDDLKIISQYSQGAKISVAGGISAENVAEYVTLNPSVIIVGSNICHASNPVEVAKAVSIAMKEVEKNV
ncbi:MAG: 3-hexulose-6-phosphate synthase [Lachnospiraceae bacterium]|nr:3-hexulose-6-phosphate synthase [Lachnospiraceae bacterium]